VNDVVPNIEVREFSVRTPGRIEHIGVRPRDWNEIREGLGSCQKANSWLGNCAWTMVGGTIGGVFGVFALWAVEKVSSVIWSLMIGATVVMVILGVVIFALDYHLGKHVKDSVEKLRGKMDSIVEESDRKDAI
jgi:hypothetical protein